MAQKSFFEKRTAQEIEALGPKKIYRARGLVDRIWALGNDEALELRFPLIPANFMNFISQAKASRKDYKHGALIKVIQPETQEEARSSPHTPLKARMKAFNMALKDLKEEEIYYIGMTWKPVQSNDRRWRVVPFDVPIEGAKLYSYAVNRVADISINEKYANAEIVRREGGQIFCEVPSRTKAKDRYSLVLMNVPVRDDDSKKAIIWSIKSNYEEGKEPGRRTYLHHLRYGYDSGLKSSDVIVFGPHEVAAYLAVIKKFWRGYDNTVPLEMNPFPLPSRAWANYSERIDNNLVIYDPTLSGKNKLRNLHLDEKCILLSRSMKVKGVSKTVSWNPDRDGPIRYYWE